MSPEKINTFLKVFRLLKQLFLKIIIVKIREEGWIFILYA